MTASAGREAKTAQAASDARSFPRKSVAILLASAWAAALAVLAFTQANPVTLNRDQILRAEVVVAARIDGTYAIATVEQQWGDGEPLELIEILNLQETAAKDGGAYILPLESSSTGSYKVVAAHVPGRPYLVYPATEAAIAQLQQLLQQ